MGYLSLLIDNIPLFFLLASLIIGCTTAFYAYLLQKLKNRYISYAIPLMIIVLWTLWVASQEYHGPTLDIVNCGYTLLYYPMIVVSILPLMDYFIKLDKRWAAAFIVATAVMFILLAYNGLKGEQAIVMPGTPLSYSLVQHIISLISRAVCVIAGYMAIIVAVKALECRNKRISTNN
ncbi:hypothetical protein Mtc_1173 [Methanocella conradii HZ254]|uniref:Uncharacterized protein n=1 Tax=Methanocella conradii (strain DSM 24694 / JCM 17849 / CGMCC 1.5162 / HZ254) TaxID=1041930 RepID=H8I7U4_METCZ|nr:hypothetical protein [Methanocella conradii]AFC99929.1 hypothetical protein Mtc_1173 [Methanocella conradii HZ254]